MRWQCSNLIEDLRLRVRTYQQDVPIQGARRPTAVVAARRAFFALCEEGEKIADCRGTRAGGELDIVL